jgi:tRNA A-37 threonylcarbamoyl transferase component Bud32
VDTTLTNNSFGTPLGSIGKYELLRVLGSGGFGTVYLARHKVLKSLVALKTLSPHHTQNPRTISRFYQEMEAVGRLRHPNIVGGIDAGEADGRHFLAMAFVEGMDVGRLLRERGPLRVADACEIARLTAEALECLAAHEMAHRDIKPSNLMLGRDGSVSVLDLGLARLRPPAGEEGGLTETGQVMGTGDFIAPEQAVESKHVDVRADLYSLGCTLYALLAGRPPFAAPEHEGFYRKLKAHNEAPVPPLRDARPDVPDRVIDLVGGLLEKVPSLRPYPPAEVARRLAPFCAGSDLKALAAEFPAGALDEAPVVDPHGLTQSFGGRPTVEKPTPQVSVAPAPRKRRPPWPIVTAAALVVAAGVSAWLLTRPAPPQLPDTKAPPGATKPVVFEPGAWYDLLERPPHQSLWPADASNSRWDYDEKRHELWVNCHERGMLRLAEVGAVTGYDLEMTIFQNPWVGGVGFYCREREETHGQDNTVEADFLLLDLFTADAKPEEARWRFGVYRRGGDPQKGDAVTWVAQAKTPRPRIGEIELKVTVKPSGIVAAQWNEHEIVLPTRQGRPIVAPRTETTGGTGIFLQNSGAVFRSVRLRVHPQPGEKS